MDQAEVSKKKFYKRWWFWVGAVFLLFVIIGVSGSSSSPSSGGTTATNSANSQPVEAIKVTAAELSADYKANEVAADAKYKGRLVEVSGIVDTIGKDILDTPYIAFAAGQYDIIDRVQCMFSKSDEPVLAAVAKGQRITLRGTVSGKLGNILVQGCAIAN